MVLLGPGVSAQSSALVLALAGLSGPGRHPRQPRGVDPFPVDVACPHGVAGSVSTRGQPTLVA